VKHYHELAAELQTRFTSRSRGEWMALLDSTDVPFSPVNTVADALADPQVEALGTLVRMVHPSEGEVVGIACPVMADGARPLGAMRAPPLIGEHTAEILAELDSKMQKQR
jgi:formyl-CoA transferase